VRSKDISTFRDKLTSILEHYSNRYFRYYNVANFLMQSVPEQIIDLKNIAGTNLLRELTFMAKRLAEGHDCLPPEKSDNAGDIRKHTLKALKQLHPNLFRNGLSSLYYSDGSRLVIFFAKLCSTKSDSDKDEDLTRGINRILNSGMSPDDNEACQQEFDAAREIIDRLIEKVEVQCARLESQEE
jgi:hypothetical protein